MLRSNLDRNREDHEKKGEKSDIVRIDSSTLCVDCSVGCAEFALGNGVSGPIATEV